MQKCAICNIQMPWSVLPMRYATIVPQHTIDKLLTTDLDVKFSMNATKCNASLDFCLWYKCFMTKMQMQFLWCRCPLTGMPLCECPLVGMPWCESYDAKCLDANTIHSKVSFIFKIRLSQRLKNIFKTQSIIPEKSPSFLLKAPKKIGDHCWKPPNGHWLGIWWSGSKDLFSQFGWAKGVARSRHFFGKMNSLKIKHFKRFIFLTSVYGNLTGVKTHCDNLELKVQIF